MPELAEVETVCRQIKKHLKGLKIRKVSVDAKDRYLFAYAPSGEVQRALSGARVTGTGRKGKYFWLELDRKPWPIFHLGMSGNVAILDPRVKTDRHQRIWEGAKMWVERDQDLRDRLLFCRFLIEAERGVEMALIDPRRFGRMWLTDDPWEHSRIKKLGYDALEGFPTAPVLIPLLKKRRKSIKSVLLDQALFAGIGNWLADEILFQAKLSPHPLASQLTKAQVVRLRTAIVSVVKKAVAVDADYERFPKSWLFHHRWGKNKDAKTSRGQTIIHEQIGGRTTAWVPGWQK